MIRDQLQQEADARRRIGHPALIQEFVLKHGREFAGAKRPKGIRCGTAHECFRNAANYATDHGGDYYEGYAAASNIGFAFLHAWIVEDGAVIELTLKKPEEYDYLGVNFDTATLTGQICENGVYGLLSLGDMINTALLRKLDNALVDSLLADAKLQRETWQRTKAALEGRPA